MNYKWIYEPPTPEREEAAKALAADVGIHPALGKLLLDRGVTSTLEAKRFFRPQLTELLDPFLFRDMRVAVDRLNMALGRKERILVYGDYDVDGCTAVALVYRFLQQFTTNIDFYIPDRYEEGYGVSMQGVDYAHETGVVNLECTGAGTPLGTGQLESDANLFGVRLCLKINAVLLIAVAGDVQASAVVVVLEVLDADAAEGRTVVLTAFCQSREGIDIVRGHIHNL